MMTGKLIPISDLDPIASEVMDLRPELLRLDIGSGIYERKNETWTTVDKFAEADVRADMWDLPYEEGVVDEIWSSHALEHVARAEVIPTLREWYRVLKVGGRCIIQVPDMDYCCKVWLKYGDEARINIFGNQDHEGEFHKTGWTPNGLGQDVESVGFEIIELTAPWTPDYNQQSIRVEARKPDA